MEVSPPPTPPFQGGIAAMRSSASLPEATAVCSASPEQQGSSLGLLRTSLAPPRDKGEALGMMGVIHNRKVDCLKMAIFELQRQNAALVGELNQCSTENIDETLDIIQESYINDGNSQNTSEDDLQHNVDTQPKLLFVRNTLEELKKIVENLIALRSDTNVEEYMQGAWEQEPQKVKHLEKRIKQLEKELWQQKLLLQQRDLQVQSLITSKEELTKQFQKQLRLQKKKTWSEVQAFLIEIKTQHLLSEALQGSQRSKQLEYYVSTLQEKFQGLLLSAQERSLQCRNTDLQVCLYKIKKLLAFFTYLLKDFTGKEKFNSTRCFCIAENHRAGEKAFNLGCKGLKSCCIILDTNLKSMTKKLNKTLMHQKFWKLWS